MKDLFIIIGIGLFTAIILGLLGLSLDQPLWWIGCLVLNGGLLYLYRHYKQSSK